MRSLRTHVLHGLVIAAALGAGARAALAQPANNACGNAISIGVGVTNYSTTGATTDGPTSGCLATNDIWFRFVSPCSGQVTVETCGSSYDTLVGIYPDGCPVTAPLGCNDDTPGCAADGLSGLGSRVTFSAVQNASYLIRVGGFVGETGTGVLTIAASQNALLNMTYQGRLEVAGAPVDGTADLRFKFFSLPTGGVQLGPTLTRLGVPVDDGLFTTVLDVPAEAISPTACTHLEIEARAPAGSGTFIVLAPRQELTAAPFASLARSALWSGLVGVPADLADGDGEGPWTHTIGVIWYNGDVGIGTGVPEARLHVLEGSAGTLTASASSSLVLERSGSNFVSILSPDANERGVAFGSPAGAIHGGIYYTNAAGLSFRTGGNTTHMQLSPTGDLGLGATASGARLRVQGAAATGDVWISPTTSGGNADLVLTENTAGSFGMVIRHKGTTNLTEFTGIQNSVENVSPAMTISRSAAGGVVVTNNLNVGGTLTKGGGAFKIDHPLDPENQYLYHSYVESPDMKNIYDGVATTDAQGLATVTLPDWFSALNRDFRYQLTVIDERSDLPDSISARVVRQLRDNQFSIRTSSPNVEVSWQVTGIRHDSFARHNRIPLEEAKPPHLRGTYLHPEAWGKPPARSEARAEAGTARAAATGAGGAR